MIVARACRVWPSHSGASRPVMPIVSLRCQTTDTWFLGTALAVVGSLVAVGLAVFGLPDVDLHGPLHFVGIMDPLCGGTRALRLATQGHWAQSWAYNPLGIPVLVAFVVLVLRAAVGSTVRRWYTLRVAWTRRRAWIAIAVILALTVALEVRQQSIATLLMGRT